MDLHGRWDKKPNYVILVSKKFKGDNRGVKAPHPCKSILVYVHIFTKQLQENISTDLLTLQTPNPNCGLRTVKSKKRISKNLQQRRFSGFLAIGISFFPTPANRWPHDHPVNTVTPVTSPLRSSSSSWPAKNLMQSFSCLKTPCILPLCYQ